MTALTDRIAEVLREHKAFSIMAASCKCGWVDQRQSSDDPSDFAAHVAAAVEAELQLAEVEAVQEVEIPARIYQSDSYIAAVRKRPVPELRIVRRWVSPWVEEQP